jgi:hypothetical protein
LLAGALLAGALFVVADGAVSVFASAFVFVFAVSAAGFAAAPSPLADDALSDSCATGAGVAALVEPRLSVL